MYPQVFTDYMTRQQKKGPLLTELPTPVYLYAMAAGDIFDFDLTHAQLKHVLSTVPATLDENSSFTVRCELSRVSAIAQGHRTVSFKLQVFANGAVVYTETQNVEVKDTGGVFVFEGPMADANKPKEIGSPMAGIIEKVMVAEGQEVKAGDVLFLVSAMKMEVKVSAPADGIIAAIPVPGPGYRVVEGALLASFK
jgi:pyruvate carboxylase